MKVYLDTNAFYFLFFEHRDYSEGVKKVFEKIHSGEYSGVTSCMTLDELAYVTLMRLIEKRYKKHPADIIRQSKAVLLEFTPDIDRIFNVIYSFNNLEIASVDKNLIGTVPIIMEKNLLLPRDCVHLRTMRDYNCDVILSTDLDFDNISGIKRLRPEDV